MELQLRGPTGENLIGNLEDMQLEQEAQSEQHHQQFFTNPLFPPKVQQPPRFSMGMST